MKLPNAYITKEAMFLDGEKVPGFFKDDPVVFPGRNCNIVTINFLVSNVVVEGDAG
jgi:hypothetical protein